MINIDEKGLVRPGRATGAPPKDPKDSTTEPDIVNFYEVHLLNIRKVAGKAADVEKYVRADPVPPHHAPNPFI